MAIHGIMANRFLCIVYMIMMGYLMGIQCDWICLRYRHSQNIGNTHLARGCESNGAIQARCHYYRADRSLPDTIRYVMSMCNGFVFGVIVVLSEGRGGGVLRRKKFSNILCSRVHRRVFPG